MTLLEEVRFRLRPKSTKFDEAEILPLIQAAEADMSRVGIEKNESDPLYRQAVVLYCKANFGYSEDAEKFQRAYEALRDAQSLSIKRGETWEG